KGMMAQTRIGYTYWQQPEENAVPPTERIDLPQSADMGVAVEGSDKWWPDAVQDAVLPEFHAWHPQGHFIEVFNRGTVPFNYTVVGSESWIEVNPANGQVDKQTRLWVNIDW